MPVYQEGPFIERALDDVLRQNLELEDGREASLEVLVVDGGSTDDTQSLTLAAASRDPRVRLLRNPARISSAGRAIGVDASTGEYVAIVDGHHRIPSSNLLRDMVELFERTGADCLARPAALVARSPTYWTDAICAARASRFGHNVGSTLWDSEERPADPRSAAAMYRRSVFERVGNFDPRFGACEDVEFNGRIRAEGLSCWTSPKLAVESEPRRSLTALWRQMFRYGVGWADVQRKHAASLTLGPVIAGAFVAGLAALALTPLFPKWLALAVIAPYAVYVALSLAASFAVAVRRPALLPALPLVYFAIHAGLGSGYLWGLARSPRREKTRARVSDSCGADVSPQKLLVFFDLPYARGPGGLYCQDAFWMFLETLGERFARLTVLGRMQTTDAPPRYRCAEGERMVFHTLPPFSSLYATGEILRGLPGLTRRVWGPVGRCDALLLGAPHPWAFVLWGLGRLRGKRVAFIARADLLPLVKHRAPVSRRRRSLLGARLVEAVFARLARTTLTFAVADAIAERYRRGAHGPVHSILISTVRASAIRPRVTRAASVGGLTRLLWVGRVDREKRPDLLLASFRALCDRWPGSLRLDLVGEGPLLAEVAALAARLDLGERVRFHGYVPLGPALRRLYETADVLVHSSATEGFPQVILEAMAAGLPVVTTAAGGIPTLLQDGVNAILVPCDDARALTAGLERLLADGELRERLASAGLAFAREHTLESESERFLKIWDSHFFGRPRGTRVTQIQRRTSLQ